MKKKYSYLYLCSSLIQDSSRLLFLLVLIFFHKLLSPYTILQLQLQLLLMDLLRNESLHHHVSVRTHIVERF